ncbi:hypothetical protein [Arthrobacter sp. USHLN218]|uniref:hypothetical protein n=1 Tax=Arthrobacter sp. USHLN218 TaxID=3081232 RepID=UPI00301AE42A
MRAESIRAVFCEIGPAERALVNAVATRVRPAGPASPDQAAGQKPQIAARENDGSRPL